nr:VWA domain-containing protein [Streptomyces sp. SID13588]
MLAPRELTARDRGGAGAGVACAVVLDDSGSMDLRVNAVTTTPDDFGSPSRKEVAVLGVRHLLAELPPQAQVQIITFSQAAGVRASGTAAELSAGGGWEGNPVHERSWTNIESALALAYSTLEQSAAVSRRAVLVSDGLPNTGLTDPAELAALTVAAADRAVHTDVVGIGTGADRGLLSRLAVTGFAEHVASRDSAPEAMRSVATSFAGLSRDVIVGSGGLDVEVSPWFQVLGVYQLDPLRRRVEDAVADGGGKVPSRISLKMGAVGAGEAGQPLFLLRLCAPTVPSKGLTPVPVLRISGWIGSGPGRRDLGDAALAMRVVDNPTCPILRRDLMQQVHSLELAEEIESRAATAERQDLTAIYQEGAHRAREIPDRQLAAGFDQALGGVLQGLDGNDIRYEFGATSSRSSTKNSKRGMLEKVAAVPPGQIRKPQEQIRSGGDDDDDEGGADGSYGPGVGYRPTVVDPDGPTRTKSRTWRDRGGRYDGSAMPPGHSDDEP